VRLVRLVRWSVDLVKKLALGLGLVVLAALGTVFAWKVVGNDTNKGALTLATQPQLTIATTPTIRSPNGDYSIVVANDGITLDGPGGSVEIGAAGIAVKGTGNVQVQAPLVRLCGSGGRPVARQNDPVVGSVGGGGGPLVGGQIAQGSPTVLAC
jgi:hypothetical protein